MAPPTVFTPSPADGGGAVEPVRDASGGSASDDPAHGRHGEHACRHAGAPACVEASHADRGGAHGKPCETMADRLIDTASDDDALAGPKAESAMVTESHRRAGRGARLAAALAESLGGRPMDVYAVDRPPGRAPEVIQPDPPVRIGTILDIVA